MTAPQSYPTISHLSVKKSTLFTPLRPEALPPLILQESNRKHRNPPYTIFMATPVQPTQFPDEVTELPNKVIKLIQKFIKWLVTTNMKNSKEWDNKSDKIYKCIHLRLEENI